MSDMESITAQEARAIAWKAQLAINEQRRLEAEARELQQREMSRIGLEIFLPLCFRHVRLRAKDAFLEAELVLYPHLSAGRKVAQRCLEEDQGSHLAENMMAVELTEAAAELLRRPVLEEACAMVCATLEDTFKIDADCIIEPVTLIKDHYRLTFTLSWRDK